MTPAITFEELLAWNCASAEFWRAHFVAHPELLELPCEIGGTANVQALVRHIWSAELIWSQRLTGLAITNRKDWPEGPLEALFGMHFESARNFRLLLANPATNWAEPMPMDYGWLPPGTPKPSSRKLLAHALFHSQRHWAQLFPLVRQAGFAASFMGDMLFSSALA